MRNFKYLLTIFFALTTSSYAIDVGDTAPDFTLVSLDKDSISLSDYSGKIVYLFFLGNGCPFCKSDGPKIESNIHKKYNQDKVQVLGIDIWRGGFSALQSFKNSTGVTFPLLNAGSAMASSLYDISIQDVTVIVNQQGTVSLVHNNYYDGFDLNSSLAVIDDLISISDIENPDTKPTQYSLSDNYPNPFNPTTTIKYLLPQNSNVKLTVYNLLGQEMIQLVNDFQNAGEYSVTFDGNSYNSGIYFYKLETESFTKIKKMTLLK